MKGVIFREFLTLVDEEFSPETTETLLDKCPLASGGAYTTVGKYDPAEMTALVCALSQISSAPADALCKVFGRKLLTKFAADRPHHFADNTLFSFLEQLDCTIHAEVLRLYPDAELPRIETQRVGEGVLELIYRSPRRFGDVAEGLLQASIAHFNSPAALSREDLEDNEGCQCVRFTLTMAPDLSRRCPVTSSSAA